MNVSDIAYYFCPMSSQIINAVCLAHSHGENIGFTASPNQINKLSYTGINSSTFRSLVSMRNKSIICERDHSTILNGSIDSWIESLRDDSKYFDIIHIDPWKYTQDFREGLNLTKIAINSLRNTNVYFEVLTEEAIRYFTEDEIYQSLQYFKNELSTDLYERILYIVCQFGSVIDVTTSSNKNSIDFSRYESVRNMLRDTHLLIKEHNGDFLSNKDIRIKFDNGVSSINIGPELAMYQTDLYLQHMNESDIYKFYSICMNNSHMWNKWIPTTISNYDRNTIIRIAGHYCYNQFQFDMIDNEFIVENLKNKILSIIHEDNSI